MNEKPIVRGTSLYCPGYSFPVEVGSGIWMDWLEKNKSFRFEMELIRTVEASPTKQYTTTETASFSACKERRPSGEFWYATRKVNGKLRRAYLGEDKRLTGARLEEIARQLHGDPEPKPESKQLHKCVTDAESPTAENERLRAEVARLEGELRTAATDFQELQKCLITAEAERDAAITKNDWFKLEAEIAKGNLRSAGESIAAKAPELIEKLIKDDKLTRNGKDRGTVKRTAERVIQELLVCVTELPINV